MKSSKEASTWLHHAACCDVCSAAQQAINDGERYRVGSDELLKEALNQGTL